MDAQKPK